jgi:CoA-binding domain
MIGGSKRLLEAPCAVLSDSEQTVREAAARRSTEAIEAIEALAQGYGHGRRHAFPGQPRQLLSQSMRFLVFDVQAHLGAFLPYDSNHSTLPAQHWQARVPGPRSASLILIGRTDWLESYSRGATIGFFALGLVALVAWRGVLAHLLAKALASGAFAERKIIVIGERDRLTSSRLLPKLGQCGYKPVSIFEINESESTASAMPQTLRDTLNSAIEAARGDGIEDILLMIGWEHSRCIEGILNVLSVLPVPVHLFGLYLFDRCR